MRPGTRVKALCSDGIVRSALILRDADTFFSIPARVTVKGRTVTGHVYRVASYDDRPGLLRFSAAAWLRNHDALPAWQDAER